MSPPVAPKYATSAAGQPQAQQSHDVSQQTHCVSDGFGPRLRGAASVAPRNTGTPHAVDLLQQSNANMRAPRTPQTCAAPRAPSEGRAEDPRMPTCVTSGLFLGGVEQTLSADRLRSLGITHIINAAREDRETHPGLFTYLHISARDSTHERLTPYFLEVAQWVDSARRAGGNALIHCRAGVSRSATLALATRMIQERIPLAQAFAQLKERRRQIEPNPQFLSELRQLELRMFGRCCSAPLTALDDLRMPLPAEAATEQTLRLMARAAAFAQESPQAWPEFTQARQHLAAQWDDPGAFEMCLLSAMEPHAGTSVHDDAAQNALRLLLIALATEVPGGGQSLLARCEGLFAGAQWRDLCIDAPLLPRQAQVLISLLRSRTL